MPTLGYAASFVTSSVHLYGFSLRGGSTWLAGTCLMAADFSCTGPLTSLISPHAYPSQPSGTSDAVLIDLTNISTSISFVGSAASGTSPFAAGELISIYGAQLGPAVGVSAQIGASSGDGAAQSGSASDLHG